MSTLKDAAPGIVPVQPSGFLPHENDGEPDSMLAEACPAASLRISDLVDLYLAFEGQELSGQTLKLRRSHLATFATAFGGRPWDHIHKSEVRAWVRSVRSWRKDSTRRNAVASIKRLFNWALDDDRIGRNPLRGLSWAEGGPRRSMTDQEYRLLLQASPPIFRRVLLFLRETGARPQDVANLEWSMIDWWQGVAVLPEHKTRRRTGKPKTLYLSRIVLNLLRWIQRTYGLFPELGTHVFLSCRGRPWKAASLSCRLQRLRDQLGLPADCVLYGLKHSLANRLSAEGVDIRTVADILSHASTRTTEKHYLHKSERTQANRAALERVSGAGKS